MVNLTILRRFFSPIDAHSPEKVSRPTPVGFLHRTSPTATASGTPKITLCRFAPPIQWPVAMAHLAYEHNA